MVFIFGWDIPIFDFMFLLLIILTASVILVWLELSRLRKLILDERMIRQKGEEDLARLEKDLIKIESGSKKAKDLEGFIADSLAKGVTEEEIRKLLLSRGWSEKPVNDAFAKVNKK